MAEGEQEKEGGCSNGTNLEERRKARILCNSSRANGESTTKYVGRFKVVI
jgi:hypothetical protein